MNTLNRTLANMFSIIFHPLFMVAYMLIVFMLVNPYLFISNDTKATGLLVISILTLSIFFPMVCIALMKMIGLISSFNMEDSKERVGPLIATGLFYIWLYLNIKDNTIIPDIFTHFLLGSIIALFISFFFNNFTKISLHSVAIAGMCTSLLMLKFVFGYNEFLLTIRSFGSYLVNVDFLIIIGILLTGIIGTSRLFLKAHTNEQIYGGYFVGFFSQVIAYFIVFI